MRESASSEHVVPVSGTPSEAAALSLKVAKTTTPPTVPTSTDVPSAMGETPLPPNTGWVVHAAVIASISAANIFRVESNIFFLVRDYASKQSPQSVFGEYVNSNNSNFPGKLITKSLLAHCCCSSTRQIGSKAIRISL